MGCGGSGGAGTFSPPCADASTPKRIAAAPGTPQSIDVRGTTLVAAFVDGTTGAGSLLRVDLSTRSTRPLVTGRASPYAVSVSSRFAYWLDSGSLGDTGRSGVLTLVRAPLDGSAGAEDLVPVTAGPADTVVADETVFFSNNGALSALAPDASAPTELVPGTYTLKLASDGNYIYWTSCGAVGRVPKGGGAAEHIADSGCALKLTTDGADVYFVDYDNQLYQVPASGGTANPIVATGSNGLGSIVMDDANVYYGASDGLYRISRAGGNPELVAAGMITDLVADDACLYWGDAIQAGVFTVRK